MQGTHKIKRRKAADIFGLSAENLIFRHPALSVVLARLFRLILLSGYVTQGFKICYIVPIPKPNEFMSKSLFCDNFRGIALHILYNAFIACILLLIKLTIMPYLSN